MRRSAIIQQDHEDMVRRSRRMTPEERLVAYANHAQLMNQMYQAGVQYRKGHLPSAKRKNPKKP
ncbi:MAG: hypothetical protein Q8R91_10180 [Candidatus Omnitrophota bacterium]|nr:hypothetical protein [Candidatus Omnitrophota bacterium]